MPKDINIMPDLIYNIYTVETGYKVTVYIANLAYLANFAAHAAQASKGNFRKTFYKTFPMT